MAAIVGILNDEQAMVFARARGRAMADFAADGDSGMAAILGGDAAEVLAAAQRNNLDIVNRNGPGQVVVAGDVADLERLQDQPPSLTRIVRLEIAGAFHTTRLRGVAEQLGRYAASMFSRDPATAMLSNRDSQVVRNGRTMLDRIAQQVSMPVDWISCLETMQRMGVTGLLEMPPAGSLTGIARRALPGVETFALNTPDELDAARSFADRHAGPGPATAGLTAGTDAGH